MQTVLSSQRAVLETVLKHELETRRGVIIRSREKLPENWKNEKKELTKQNINYIEKEINVLGISERYKFLEEFYDIKIENRKNSLKFNLTI